MRIQLRGVTNVYASRSGTVVALENVSCVLESGLIHVFVGPNGCGKSTLMHVLAGLTVPERGEVTQDDAPLSRPNLRSWLLRQDHTLLPWLTARANIEWARPKSRLHPTRPAPTPSEMLTAVGMAERQDAYPGQLSGGEAQRTALAMALATERELLLLDEPFASVDELTRTELCELVRATVMRPPRTAVLVTHSVLEAAYLADCVWIMSREPNTIREVLRFTPGEDIPTRHSRVISALTARPRV